MATEQINDRLGPGGLTSVAVWNSDATGLVKPDGTASTVPFKSFRGALVRKAADLTAQNFTTPTVLTWDTEVYDTDAFHHASVNTDRLTVPTGLGITKVRVLGQININNVASGYDFNVAILKDGVVAWPGAPYARVTGSANGFTGLNVVSPVVEVADGAYFTIRLLSATDTSVDIDSGTSWFAIEVVETTEV